MALIPQTFIDDLLDRVDIVDVINARVPLKKQATAIRPAVHFMKKKHLPLPWHRTNSSTIVLAVVQGEMHWAS